MKHRLLILGTLGEFVQLVCKAREKGYYTIVCDGYPDGPAREFADEAYQIPVTDTEKIAELCREKKIDGIITSFSDLLLECMVKIADRAGIPGQGNFFRNWDCQPPDFRKSPQQC